MKFNFEKMKELAGIPYDPSKVIGEETVARDLAEKAGGVTGYSVKDLYIMTHKALKQGNVEGAIRFYNEIKAKGGDMHLADLIFSTGKLPGAVKKMHGESVEDEEENLTEWGGRRAYPRDPYWLTAKYPGKDANGKPFKKGDKVFYYPNTKTFLTGKDAEKASREFEAAKQDEYMMTRGM